MIYILKNVYYIRNRGNFEYLASMHLVFFVLILGSPLLVSGYSYENGIVKCPTEDVGVPFTVTIAGVDTTFTKVNHTMLDVIIAALDYENLTTVCTTGVEDMSSMFYFKANFNSSISTWDTSSVKNMGGMFWGAESFN